MIGKKPLAPLEEPSRARIVMMRLTSANTILKTVGGGVTVISAATWSDIAEIIYAFGTVLIVLADTMRKRH